MENDFDPYQNAHLLMWSHILQKGFQAGSLIGSVAVGPILGYRSGKWSTVVNTAGRSALVSVILSGMHHTLLGVLPVVRFPVQRLYSGV